MKNFFLKILFFFLILPSSNYAEVIDVRNEEKAFGEWKIYCEIDEMMGYSHCKIASKFFDNSSVITLQPFAKFANQFFIIIPQISLGSFVKIRVDQNDLILSKNLTNKDFGLIPLDDQQKNMLFLQMKTGDYLFLRFNIRNQPKEITARINLQDFRNALDYYSVKTSK